MRVRVQPEETDLRELLREILAPHGLDIAPGPRGSVLIVAAPSPPPAAAAAPEARAREPPAPSAHAAPPAIEELIVAASRYELERGVGVEPIVLSGLELEQLPDLGDDALRAVQRLPGAASNGFSARANVRGGDANETLVRLDDLRLYDPFHLESFQSIFSVIDPRAVSRMAVYTGGFPAKFGDRMSGVIDVASLAPPAPLYHEVTMSFFNASLLSAGELADGAGEWVATVRRSNLDLLYDAFSARQERPGYTDAFGRFTYRLGDELQVSANVLYSSDDVELADDLDVEERASARDDDRYVWLRLDHILRDGLRGSTLVARSTLDTDRRGTSDKPGIGTGRLVDRRTFTIDSVQSDWSWQPRADADWLVEAGGVVSRSRGRYDYEDEAMFELLFDAPGAARDPARARDIELAVAGEHAALYGDVRFRPARRLSMELGLRWERQTLDPSHDGTFGPRIGLRYALSERTAVRAAWGRFAQSQAINELPVADGALHFLPPQRAEHRVLGIEHAFESGIGLRVEAYEKEMSALRPRYENLLHTLTLLPELKPDRIVVAPASATARGVELRVDAAPDERLDWWVSYTRSSVRDRIGDERVYRSWDQPRTLSGGASFATDRWQFGGAAMYRSGWPTTGVLELVEGGAVPAVATGPRNAARTGAFRSVDLRVTRTFRTRRGSLAAFLEINNAFDSDNACCDEYQVERDDDDEPVLELTRVDYLPRVPSLGFVWSF
jgi:hypothetical protein